MKKYFIILYLSSIMTLSYGQTNNIPWKVTSPEEEGMNSLTFIDGINHFKQNNINIHSLLVIRNDHIVLDACFYPFQKKYVHDLASVTKSVTSILIGIAIDKGFIKDENQLVYQYFPEYNVINDTLRALRIKDLLNMTSGLQCSWNDGEKELNQMTKSVDWVKFMFDLPFEAMPGEKFSYCSGNFYLLAEILQRTTKLNCHDFARKFLFNPLDFGESYWLKNGKGVNHGWGDLHISTYDMAKIGCLLLDSGKWNGNQLVSKEWIGKIKPLYKIQKTESYGYGWWLDSENPDEIQAVGRGGQRLFIFRDRKMVIATTGGGFEAGDIDNLALEAIKSYKENINFNAGLQQLVKSIQFPENKNLKMNKDEFSSGIINKCFCFMPNGLELKSIRFEQKNKKYYIVIDHRNDEIEEEHRIGMNNQYEISKERTFGLPMAVKANWINKNTLIINYNELCRIQNYELKMTFLNDTVNLIINEPSKGIHETLTGKYQ